MQQNKKCFIWLLLYCLLFNYSAYGQKTERKRLITLKKALDSSIYGNYENRIKAESVYQAHHNIKVAISRLLPSLNFSTIMAVSNGSTSEITASSLGFLFPSNWFRWKESKLFHKAEQSSYATLLGNIVNITESLYYKVHMLKNTSEIITKYIIRTEKILKEVEERFPGGRPHETGLYETRNFLYKLRQDRNKILTTLKNLGFELLYTLGTKPKKWTSVEIENLELPNPLSKKPWKTKDFLAEAYKNSQEIKTQHYLLKASKYSTFTRYFNFALPSSDTDSNLGFGYISQVKIGKSIERQRKIELQRAKAIVRLQVEKTVQNFNLAANGFATSIKIKENGEALIDHLYKKFKNENIFNDNYVDGLAFALRGELRMMQAKHTILVIEAQRRRLIWGDSRYKEILKIALKKGRLKTRSLRKLIENRRIRKNEPGFIENKF